MSFMVPAIIGNALLWKMPRENKSALLAGLYIVRKVEIDPAFF